MSVDNFDGNGLVDQPSIVYAFETDDSGDVEVRELSRSGFGDPGPSPGNVIEPETTKSDSTDSPAELDFSGQNCPTRDNCSESSVPICLNLAADDPAKARTKPTPPHHLFIYSLHLSTQVQQNLKDKRLKKPHTTTSTQTWPVSARCGSRMCCFFGNRNKRLASRQWPRWLLRPVRGASMTPTQSNERQKPAEGPPVEQSPE